jgi:uncharacterized membrane protein
MYDVILRYTSYLFFVVGLGLVIVPPILAYNAGVKQSKEVFLMNSFLPNITGLLFLAFAYWTSLQNVRGDNDKFWQILVIVTAVGGLAVSTVSTYQSVVLLRWRSD